VGGSARRCAETASNQTGGAQRSKRGAVVSANNVSISRPSSLKAGTANCSCRG
jgi:hypothetical protein